MSSPHHTIPFLGSLASPGLLRIRRGQALRALRERVRASLAFAALASTWAACDDSAPAGSSRPSPAIEGTITYDGTVAGDLQVAVFASFPPHGEPLAIKRVAGPTFPYHYSIDDLPPGRYFVLAMVDADPADGDNFRPQKDPGGAVGGYLSPQSVTVAMPQGPARGDIQLSPPAARSPYLTGSYR